MTLHTSSHMLLILTAVALGTTLACGPAEGDESTQNSWTLDDRIDQGASPDMMSSDMSTPDMETRDMPPVVDMPAPVTDMPVDQGDGVDMSVEPDMPVDMPPAPRVCEDPQLQRVTLDQLITGRLPGGRSQSQETPCDPIAQGKEESYVLEIEEETVVDIWTTQLRGETSDFIPVLFLADGCTPVTQDILGCGGGFQIDESSRNASIRQRLAAGDYILTIGERFSQVDRVATGGDYVIHVDRVSDLEANGLCEQATPLVPNASYFQQLTSGRGDRGSERSCFEGRNLLYYQIDVPAKHGLQIRTNYTETDRSIYVRIDTGCERNAESFCEKGRWVYGNDAASLANELDIPQSYVISVDVDQAIDFVIRNEVVPLAPNAFCEQAIPLPSGAPGQDQEWLKAGPREPICGINDPRRSLYYSHTVPDQHRLYMFGSFGASVRSGCGDIENQCLETPYINRTGQAQDLILMSSIPEGYHNLLTSNLIALSVPLATNSSCLAPTPLTTGAVLTGQDIRQGSEMFNPCGLVDTDGQPTLYYSMGIQLGGAGKKVIVTPNDPANLSLSVQVLQRNDDPALCSTGICQMFSDGYFRGTSNAELIVSPNFGGGRDPIPALIAVTMDAGYELATDTTFTITIEELAN